MVCMAKAFAKAKCQGGGKTCISAGVRAKAAFSGRSRVVKKHAPASGQRVGDKAKAKALRAKASTTAKGPPTLKATGKGKAHAAPRELRPERKAKAQAKAMPAASLKVAAKTAKTKATATGSTNGKAKVAATALANRLRGKTRAAALGKVKARPRVRPRIRRDALAAMVHDILWDLLSEGWPPGRPTDLRQRCARQARRAGPTRCHELWQQGRLCESEASPEAWP